MKSKFLLALSLILSSCLLSWATVVPSQANLEIGKATDSPQRTVINGVINEVPKNRINLVRVEITPILLLNQGYVFVDTLDEEGKFHISFNLPRSFVAYIVYGNRQKGEMFVHPGDSLYVDAHYNNVSRTSKYTGKGDIRNNFLSQFNKKFGATGKRMGYVSLIKQLEAVAYKQLADSLCSMQQAYFNEFKEKEQGKVSQDFEDFINASIDYEWGLALLNYPFLHRRYNRAEKLPDLPDNYYDFLETMTLQNDEQIFTPAYVSFIDGYATQQVLKQNLVAVNEDTYDYNQIQADKYEKAKEIFNKRSMYYVMAKSIIDGCQGKVELVVPKYQEFLKKNPFPEYKQMVDLVYNRFKHLAAGNPAPNFSLKDKDGKQVALSDFKGKVVYLDFWATWCGPCKKQIPDALKLKKKFKGKEVEFVYISTDKKTDKWEDFLEKNEDFSKSVHLLASTSTTQAVKQQYNIKSIPSYFLIDKNGKIADSKAKRPSMEGIAADIEALLK